VSSGCRSLRPSVSSRRRRGELERGEDHSPHGGQEGVIPLWPASASSCLGWLRLSPSPGRKKTASCPEQSSDLLRSVSISRALRNVDELKTWRRDSSLQGPEGTPDSSGRGSRRFSTLQPERLRHGASSRTFHGLLPGTVLIHRDPHDAGVQLSWGSSGSGMRASVKFQPSGASARSVATAPVRRFTFTRRGALQPSPASSMP